MNKKILEPWESEDILRFIRTSLDWPWDKCDCDIVKQDLDNDEDVCMRCQGLRILEFMEKGND